MELNIYKSINFTGRKNFSGGTFGGYYKYSKNIGIKVLYSNGHKTIISLKNSRVWRRATKENTLLKKCKKRYGFIPNGFGVFPIKIGKYYYPGICMEHIHGKTLYDIAPKADHSQLIISIDKALRKQGIYHDDLHKGNIILSNDCYYIIDFTYDLIWLSTGFNEDKTYGYN